MKHVTYGEKPLMIGDEAAGTLIEYARLLADGRADTVALQAISPDGHTVEATFLLGANSVLIVEWMSSEVIPPDNSPAVEEVKDASDPSLIASVTWAGITGGVGAGGEGSDPRIRLFTTSGTAEPATCRGRGHGAAHR